MIIVRVGVRILVGVPLVNVNVIGIVTVTVFVTLRVFEIRCLVSESDGKRVRVAVSTTDLVAERDNVLLVETTALALMENDTC